DTVTTGAGGLCKCPKYVHAQRVPQQERPKYAYYTYMSYYNTRYTMLLKIVPDSLRCSHMHLNLSCHRAGSLGDFHAYKDCLYSSLPGRGSPLTLDQKARQTSLLRGSPLAVWGHTSCNFNKSIQVCILAHQ